MSRTFHKSLGDLEVFEIIATVDVDEVELAVLD